MPDTWKPRINPAFHRHKDEAAIIGRIVVAFGELEYLMVNIAARAAGGSELPNRYPFFKALYRLRTTSSRIDAADALMRPSFLACKYEGQYGQAFGALKYCLRIRNQYAHCNWADDGEDTNGLYFADLEESAQATIGWEHHWYHVDVPILETQEAYFVYTQTWLYNLESVIAEATGRPIYPATPAPLIESRPLLHNPASAHVPHWISAEEKEKHLKRAQEAESRAG
jgi:hypothetical protein